MTAVVILAIVAAAAAAIGGALALALQRSRREIGDLRGALSAAEAERGRADRRRRALLEALPVTAMRVDREARIADLSAAAKERFPFLVPGMPLVDAFGDHLLREAVGAALGSGEPARLEVRLFTDGRRTFRAAIDPLVVDGEPGEALVFLSDASEAVAYQELRSQFVANVSHELRTPLTGMRGLLEALEDPAMDPAVRGDFVARCAREAQRLEALIGDILFLSELESTPGAEPGDRCDLGEAASATAAELAGLAEDHGVGLSVEVAGPAPVALTERMGRTLVRNLAENALKYAGPGARAVVAVDADGGRVELRVSDDGAGIPERHLAHVFERFYRADPSRSKRLGGTGLGLSIVKHIAERLGGVAAAESREGFGTTVTVTLPRASDDGSA